MSEILVDIPHTRVYMRDTLEMHFFLDLPDLEDNISVGLYVVLVQGGVGGRHAPELVTLDQVDIRVQVGEDVLNLGRVEDVEVEPDPDMSSLSGVSSHGDQVAAKQKWVQNFFTLFTCPESKILLPSYYLHFES